MPLESYSAGMGLVLTIDLAAESKRPEHAGFSGVVMTIQMRGRSSRTQTGSDLARVLPSDVRETSNVIGGQTSVVRY